MISPKYTSRSPVKWNSISEVDCQRWLFCSSLTGNKLFLSSSASKQLLFEGMPGIPSIWLFSHSSGNADWMSCIVLGSGDPVVKAKLNADPCETHILIRWRHDKLQKYMDWWVLDKTRKTPPGQIKKSPISSWKKGLHHLSSVVCCRQWRSQSHPPLSQRHLSLVMRMSCHQDRVRDQLTEWKACRLWNYVRTGNWGANGRTVDGKRSKKPKNKVKLPVTATSESSREMWAPLPTTHSPRSHSSHLNQTVSHSCAHLHPGPYTQSSSRLTQKAFVRTMLSPFCSPVELDRQLQILQCRVWTWVIFSLLPMVFTCATFWASLSSRWHCHL